MQGHDHFGFKFERIKPYAFCVVINKHNMVMIIIRRGDKRRTQTSVSIRSRGLQLVREEIPNNKQGILLHT